MSIRIIEFNMPKAYARIKNISLDELKEKNLIFEKYKHIK